MTTFEVASFVVQEKSLPQWMRKLGVVCAFSEYVPHWGGPDPEGLDGRGATTLHLATPITFWFFVPDGGPEIDEKRIPDAALYVAERLTRRSHHPKGSWTNVVFRSDGYPNVGNPSAN